MFLKSKGPCSSALELSIVHIGLGTYRRYESETKREAPPSCGSQVANETQTRRASRKGAQRTAQADAAETRVLGQGHPFDDSQRRVQLPRRVYFDRSREQMRVPGLRVDARSGRPLALARRRSILRPTRKFVIRQRVKSCGTDTRLIMCTTTPPGSPRCHARLKTRDI